MSERITVFGEDALSRALRARAPQTSRPLTLVTDPARLMEAEAALPPGGFLAVTAFSPGGATLSREMGLAGLVATFSSMVPLDEARLTDVSLPASLPGEEREDLRQALEEALGPVEVVQDGPGLVSARVVTCLANEAAWLLGEGGAKAVDIDRAMTLGVNYPRGPLCWADLIGLDQVERLLLALSRDEGARTYRPAPLLSRLVAEGKTGQLAGEGFFSYSP